MTVVRVVRAVSVVRVQMGSWLKAYLSYLQGILPSLAYVCIYCPSSVGGATSYSTNYVP